MSGQYKGFPKLFFLPSTTDRKENINELMKNVSVDSNNCTYENFMHYSSSEDEFIPQNLDSTYKQKELFPLKLF